VLHPAYGDVHPDIDGPWLFGLESAGRSVLNVDGQMVIDNSAPERGHGFYGAGSTLLEQEYVLVAGRAHEFVVELWPRAASSPVLGVRVAAERPRVTDRIRTGRSGRAERRCRRGRRRVEPFMGVRGVRPARPLAAPATSAGSSRR